MKIPNGVSIELRTDGIIEMHVNAAITKREQANELIAAIRQISGALEGVKRTRRSKDEGAEGAKAA